MRVSATGGGRTVRKILETAAIDLVVLNIMMPQKVTGIGPSELPDGIAWFRLLVWEMR